MYRDLQARLRPVARRAELFSIGFGALAGIIVGAAFAVALPASWSWAFGGFLFTLSVGMVAVLLAVASERVAPNDWRSGLNLSSRLFLAQTSLYSLAIIGMSVASQLPASILSPGLLALRMLPGLYICTVMAIVLSAPLYFRWVPAPR